MSKKLKINLIAMSIFIVFGIAILCISQNATIAEWLTKNVSFLWLKVFGHVFSWIPFNVFEVLAFLFALVSVALLVFIIVDYVHKNVKRANINLTSLILTFVIIGFLYSSIVGVMYNREELDIDKVDYLMDSENAITISNTFFNDFNTLASEQTINSTTGETICPYTDKELIELLKQEHNRLDSDYFSSYTSNPKSVASSYIMSALGIMGITFNLTVEAGYNNDMLSQDKVVAIAHELAHTKGVMREEDANITAYYLLLTSDNSYLKYIGYLNVYGYMYNVFVLNNATNNMNDFVFESNIIADVKASNKWWKEKNVLNSIGEFFNNIYLKINGESGTDSYSSSAEYNTDVNEETNEIIYTVSAYSNMQNMIFKIYEYLL